MRYCITWVQISAEPKKPSFSFQNCFAWDLTLGLKFLHLEPIFPQAEATKQVLNYFLMLKNDGKFVTTFLCCSFRNIHIESWLNNIIFVVYPNLISVINVLAFSYTSAFFVSIVPEFRLAILGLLVFFYIESWKNCLWFFRKLFFASIQIFGEIIQKFSFQITSCQEKADFNFFTTFFC